MRTIISLGLGKQLYKIVTSLTMLILIMQSVSSFAGTELDGFKIVCEGEIYTYKIDPATGVTVKPGTDWSINGGRIIDSDRKWAKVIWEGVEEHKLSVRVYLANGFGGHWHKDLSITATYKDVGKINRVDIADKKASYCVGENIQASIAHTLKSDLEYSIAWKRYFNGSLESTQTTTNPDEVINFYINMGDGEYKYTVQATESEGCVSNDEPVDNTFKVKSNALQNTSIVVTQNPSCHNGRNTIIKLDNIPDYRSTYWYNHDPGNGEYSVTFTGSGITYDRHIFNYESPHEINEDNIQLTNQNDPPEIIKGLPGGTYVVEIENAYFCKKQQNKTVINPPEFIWNNTVTHPYGPVHEYSYDAIPSDIYNIQTWNGTDRVYFKLEGGTVTATKQFKINGNDCGTDPNITLTGIDTTERTYVITDGNGCPLFELENPVIKLKAPPPFELDTDNTATSPVDCHRDDFGDTLNGTAAIYVKGGIGPYKLSYNGTDYFTNSSRPNFFNITGLEEGIHDYTITHYGGDEALSTEFESTDLDFTITQPGKLDVTFSDMTPPICLGGKTGSISLFGSGGNKGSYNAANFSINLTSGVTETFDSTSGKISYTGLDSIDYVFTIDDTKCTQNFPYKIESNPTPADFVFDDISKITCLDYNDGKVTVSGFDGNPDNGNYDFYLDFVDLSISPKISAGSHTYDSLVPGTHTIHIADTNDCLNTVNGDPYLYMKPFFIEEPLRIDIGTEIVNVGIKGEATGAINIDVAGGNENYRYEVKDSNDVIVDSGKVMLETGKTEAIVNIDSLNAGKYNIYIQDTCECSNGKSFNGGKWMRTEAIIQEPASALSFTSVIRNVSCKGLSNGKVELYGTGGWEGDGYKYGRDKNIMSKSGIFEGLSAGKYAFFVKDHMGVLYSDTIEVLEPADIFELSVSELGDVKCYGGNDGFIELNPTGGTAPYEYSIDNNNWIPDNKIDSLSKGNYTVWANDKNGCPAYIDTSIDQPEALDVSFEEKSAHCGQPDGSITAIVTGGVRDYYYNWLKDGVTIGNDSSLLDRETYIYGLLVTDKNNCNLNTFTEIGTIDGPQISINNVDTVSCEGMADASVSFTLRKGIPEYSAEIRNQNNEILETLTCDSAITCQFNNLSSGDYFLWITDAAGCPVPKEFTVSSPEKLKINPVELTNPTCFGYADAQIKVLASGGNTNYMYQWNNGSSNNNITNLEEGTYTLTVTDSKACSDSATYSIINPEALKVSLGEDAYLCEGQEYILNLGNYENYQWKMNDEIIGTGESISVSEQAEYSVWVQDVKGCNAYDTLNIFVSRDLLKADFIMPSNAYENDTVMAIDISWPVPDQVLWSFDENIININSENYSEEFTFKGPGVYTVALKSLKALCVDSLKKQIVVLADTSANNKQIKLGKEDIIVSHKVFPNPNRGIFKLELELSRIEPIKVMIYSMQQNTYILIQEFNGQNNYSLDYSFSNLVPGIYYVIIEAGNERKSVRVLII